MALDLSAMTEEVRDAHANRANLSDDRIQRALNFGQERVAREPVHWQELERKISFTVREGVYEYRISGLAADDSDVHESYNLWLMEDETRFRVAYRRPRVFDTEFTVQYRARPVRYTVWGTDLLFGPIPEEDYQATYRYAIWPKPLSEGSQISDLKNKDGIIVAFAISHLFQTLGNDNSAARWFTIARDQLRNARASVDNVSDETSTPGEGMGVGNYWVDPFVRSVY